MDDRTVHARRMDGTEIVRYDRAGKWYVEHKVMGTRQHVTFAEAVRQAREADNIFTGLPGGGRFDAAMWETSGV